jgi:REP element-mobilizing transposase RayT
MARKPRVHFPGALYHVIARGNQGQSTFREAQDYRLYLKFLREYKEHFDFLLYAYVLMPTHVHLLIETGNINLSKVMHRLQFRYTRNFNLKYRTWGHLFQGRYKAILCDRDTYFLELSAYIHLNPVRAGLVKTPAEYPWSSYPSYLGREKSPIADIDQVLSQFSDRKGVARKKYDLFIRDRLAQGHRNDFYETKDQRFLGGDEYLKDVERHIHQALPFTYEITLEEIVSQVGSAFEIPIDLLYSSTRSRQGAWGRAVCAYLGRGLGGHRIREIAEHFDRDSVAITYGLKKVEQRLREDKKVRAEVTSLENSLIKNKRRKIKT